MGRLKEI